MKRAAFIRRAVWIPWAVVFSLLATSWGLGCHRTHDGEIEGFRCEAELVHGPPACPEGLTCVSGVCTDVGVPMGHRCDDDTVCPAGTECLDPGDFGEDGPRVCSRLCCGSVECGPPEDGLVCRLGVDTTGGFCWPANKLERSAPGTGRAGADCESPTDCRSAVCEGGRCDGACCGDSYCDGGTVCRARLAEISEREVFACAAGAGPNMNGICDSDDDCASGRCMPAGEMLSICATPCCSSSDCVEVLVTNVPRPVACASMGTTLRSCSRIMPTGATGQVGSPCGDGNDCRSGLCLEAETQRICSDSCCSDESCGDPSAFACVPVMEEATWVLRCVPK